MLYATKITLPSAYPTSPAVLVFSNVTRRGLATLFLDPNGTCFIGDVSVTDATGFRVHPSNTSGYPPFKLDVHPGDELWAKTGDNGGTQILSMLVDVS